MGTCYHFEAMGIKEVQAIMNLSPAMFYDYMRQEMPEACNDVADLLICPNPALNYCRKLLMSFAV